MADGGDDAGGSGLFLILNRGAGVKRGVSGLGIRDLFFEIILSDFDVRRQTILRELQAAHVAH